MIVNNRRVAGRMGLVARLAWFDMAHEAIMSLCLVFAVASVLTPILLLAAVKYGFIDSLREDLIADPSFREIQPISADLRQLGFFDQLREWPEVQYVVPSVMLTPREVTTVWKVSGGEERDRFRLIPSSDQDPVLSKLVGEPPSQDGVVVTQSILEASRLTLGDDIRLVVDRLSNDQRERAEVNARIVGVVPTETEPQPTIFGSSRLDNDIESFRAGIAVPARGWASALRNPTSVYDKIVAVFGLPPGEGVLSDLRIRVGSPDTPQLSSVEVLASLVPTGASAATWSMKHGSSFVVLTNPGKTYTSRDLETAQAVADARAGKIYGIVDPSSVRIGQSTYDASGLWTDLLVSSPSNPVVWTYIQGATLPEVNGVLLPQGLSSKFAIGSIVQGTFGFAPTSATKELTLPLRVLGYHEGAGVLTSYALLAMVARGRNVPIVFDQVSQSVAELSSGFRGFRLVARSLDDVPLIVERLKALKVAVSSKSDAIIKLQRLDRSLDLLVGVVAGVALIGGLAVLASSFYGNVQRKAKNIAVLRLIGFSRRNVFMFPVFQGIFTACLGFCVSVGFYGLISWVVNTFVVGELGFSGELARLNMWLICTFFAATLWGAVLSSLFAAQAATGVDPAEAIRHE